MLRINLISNPRNLSTALMYSFAQRPDTVVIDEPFYAHYLRFSKTPHPGRDEIMNNMEEDPDIILSSLLQEYPGKQILFIKNMANHVSRISSKKWLDFINVIYIRDPAKVISSFSHVIHSPTVEDVGYKFQYLLYHFLLKHGIKPVVIDSRFLLNNPKGMLMNLCAALEICFDEKMLQWKAGPRKEDGPWAKFWYGNVHKTTGFKKQKTSSRILPDHCNPVYEECVPYYNALFDVSIKL